MDIKVIASGSTGNCYLVSDGRTDVLIDAGITFKAIQVGCDFKTSKISGCLITHCHGDHSKAIKDLVKRGIPVYTGAGTLEAKGVSGPGAVPVSSMEEFTIGTFNVMAFDVQHDAPDSLGFLLTSTETGEKLLYVTDSAYIKYKFTGLTHIMAEANYDVDIIVENARQGRTPAFLAERVIQTHMSIETLLGLLKANDLSKVKQIYLLHLSDGNSDENKFKELVQKATGAEVYVY